MANLNIPFVLLQKDTCQFRPAINSSHLVHHSKFNLRSAAAGDVAARNQGAAEQDGSSGGILSYLGGVFSGSGDTLSTKNFNAPIQFDATKENLLVLADEKTGALALCSHEMHGCDGGVSRLLVNI